MSVSFQRPNHIVSLATAAVIACVRVKVWTGTKQDKESSDELTDAKKADRKAARVTQNLLVGDEDHKSILNYRQTVYNWFERETYPWAGRQGLLPCVRIPRFMKSYEEHAGHFNEITDKFFGNYQGKLSDLAFRRGDMFNRNDYLSVDALRFKFGISLYTSEVPQGDFRNQISEELASDLQWNFEKQATNMVNEIMEKQSAQLVSVMESISNCCQVEVMEDGKVKRKKLYDSTINRALEFCETFKSFNLTQNPALESARSDLESLLAGVSLDALRESDSMRSQVKEEVDDILKRFGGSN